MKLVKKNPEKVYFYQRWESDVAELRLYSDGVHLVALTYPENDEDVLGRLGIRDEELVEQEDEVIAKAKAQLQEYFRGERKEFDLPLDSRGTEFQKRAWEELKKIPWGSVISYAEQAKRMDAGLAFRAVGSANGRNPLSIVIPCHRVLGSNGKISGYAGRPEVKATLLTIEGLVFDDGD